MIPEGRRRAKGRIELVHPSLKGKSCRGLLFPVSALGIGGFIVPTGSKQSMLLSMYRCLAGITNTPVMKLFLRERAYPFIPGVIGDFYEDYIQRTIR